MGRKRPQEASRSVAKYLAPNETVVLELRQHWARILPAVLSCGAGLALVLIAGFMASASLGVLTNLAWWLWLVLVAHLAWRVIEWWDETFVITNRRLILVHGIFIKKVAMMPLSKVTDMSYNRSLAARLLGYGTFVMESAGQEQALSTINFVRNPDAIYRELCGLIFGDAPEAHNDSESVPLEPNEMGASERWHDSWQEWQRDWVDDHTRSTAPQPRHGQPVTQPTVPIDVRPAARRVVDDTDPYGMVTARQFGAESRDDAPYPVGIDSSYDDQDVDSAWSVSHEHATRPQSARRSRGEGPQVETWER